MDTNISNILQFAEVDLIWFAIYLGMITSVLAIMFVIYGMFKGE